MLGVGFFWVRGVAAQRRSGSCCATVRPSALWSGLCPADARLYRFWEKKGGGLQRSALASGRFVVGVGLELFGFTAFLRPSGGNVCGLVCLALVQTLNIEMNSAAWLLALL